IRDRNVTGVQTCALPISARTGRGEEGSGDHVRGRRPGFGTAAGARMSAGDGFAPGGGEGSNGGTGSAPNAGAASAGEGSSSPVRSEERRGGKERQEAGGW